MSSPSRPTLPHNPALDGLRGIGVVGVLLYHGRHLQGGYLGVDLFFVLSGFLITTLLLLEWGTTSRIALGGFWVRRAKRLLPALLLLVFVAALWARFVALPVDLSTIRGSGLAALLYVANWHSIAVGQDYFQASLAPSPLEHVWSLAIEEQFYLVWPVLVIGLLKLRNRPGTIFGASVVIATASAALMVGLHQFTAASNNSLYLGTHTRVGAVAMGAALASWRVAHRKRAPRLDPRVLEGVGLACVAFLAWAWASIPITSSFLYSGGLTMCSLAATGVVAAIAVPGSRVLARGLSWGALTWIGTISYGLYLWHWPIFLFLTQRRTGLSGWWLFALQVAASVAIAFLSYHLVEQPIRRGTVPSPTLGWALPISLIVVVAALLASTTGAIDVGGVDKDMVASGALEGKGAAGTPKVMLFGDSVAGEVAADGIVPNLSKLDITLASGIQYGCNPMRAYGRMKDHTGFDREGFSMDCTTAWRAKVLDEQPDVAVVMLGGMPVYTVEIDGVPRTPCDREYRTALTTKMASIFRDVGSTGAKVEVVTNAYNDDGRFLATMPKDLKDRVACTNAAYRDAARKVPGVQVVDLGAKVCPPGKRCTQDVPGGKLRADGIHFQDAGAVYVARWLVPQVLAQAQAQAPD